MNVGSFYGDFGFRSLCSILYFNHVSYKYLLPYLFQIPKYFILLVQQHFNMSGSLYCDLVFVAAPFIFIILILGSPALVTIR